MLQNQLRDSYEHLIASGCDRRLLPGADGLNVYGAAWAPRDAIAFSSCTCSTPSRRVFTAGNAVLKEIQEANEPSAIIRETLTRARASIRACLQLSSDIAIALTPSGTDVELLALALIAEPGNREIVNVIVAPHEVGSGTLHAASACHYDTRLPRGKGAVIGQCVNESLASRVTLEQVGVRDERGKVLAAAEIDAEVTQIVAESVDRGAQVIVHLVAHSKTGIHAPSLDLINNITKTLPGEVTVVVDAAQGRLDPAAYQIVLDRGCFVSFTGSKYFGGPPFAGALLLPAEFDPVARGLTRLPDGFENYFSRSDLPESWSALRTSLENWYNLGSVLRWHAAASEMNAYFQIDSATREKIARGFGQSVRHWFGESSSAVTIAPHFENHDENDNANSCLPSIESVPTVFSLAATNNDGQPLSVSELREMHRQLNSDCESGDAFHLGQPVMIGENRAVLRIALGASLLIDLASNPRIGSSLLARIAWLHQRIGRLSERCNEIALAERPIASPFPDSRV